MSKRRRFTEREVLAALHFNHSNILCYRCRKPLEPHQAIEREHLTEVAIGGLDEPQNAAYSHRECHAVVTNGTPASSVGSSKQRIAKVRRISKGKMAIKRRTNNPTFVEADRIGRKRWPPYPKLRSRPFPKIQRPIRGKP